MQFKLDALENPDPRFILVRHKVPDNGAVHSVKERRMMQSIQDMLHRPNAIWFDQDDVTYQRETDREFPAVYILDDDTRVAGVFEKQTVTTCQLTEEEIIELKFYR